LREIIAVLSLEPLSGVIVGDLNERPNGNVYEKLQKMGYVDSAAISQKENIGTNGTRRIDYVWIHRESPIELTDYQVVREPELGQPLAKDFSSVSDHSLIRVSLAFK